MNNGSVTKALLIVLVIGVVVGYIRPAWEEIGVVQDEIFEIDQALENAERNNQELAQLIRQADQISDQSINDLEAFLPPTVDSLQLMSDIATIAEFSNVTVESMAATDDTDPTPVVIEGQSGEVTTLSFSDITLTMSATYEDMKSFLASVERNKNFLEVASISFGEAVEAGEGGPSTQENGYALVLRAYSYQPSESDEFNQ